MTNVLFVDPVDVVGDGHRRHTYVKGATQMVRSCNQPNRSLPASKPKQDLVQMTATEFASDPNACQRCVQVEGIAGMADDGANGAEAVDTDPYGVFDDDQDGSDPAEPGQQWADPGGFPDELTESRLVFDFDNVDPVLDGEVDLTARIELDDFLVPGDIIKLEDPNGDDFAVAEVMFIARTDIQRFVRYDWKRHRKYDSVQDMVERFRGYYDTDQVWPDADLYVIGFDLLTAEDLADELADDRGVEQ